MRCQCGRQFGDRFPIHCACGRRHDGPSTVAQEEAKPATHCRYLGERTGETWACSTCGGHSGRVPIYRCEIHATCLMRKPAQQPGAGAWQGGVCTHCSLRDDWPAADDATKKPA